MIEIGDQVILRSFEAVCFEDKRAVIYLTSGTAIIVMYEDVTEDDIRLALKGL